jgi:hypothetical protein
VLSELLSPVRITSKRTLISTHSPSQTAWAQTARDCDDTCNFQVCHLDIEVGDGIKITDKFGI